MAQHDEMVSKLDRDLRFFPTGSHSPRTLTLDQVRFYNEQGFLTGLRAFRDDQVRTNRDNFDRILQKFLDEGKDSYAIDRYQDKFSAIYDIAISPGILDYLEDIIGPNIICWATHYFCKLPGDDKGVSWHQDCSYWALTPSKTVTVWLAIDAADRENGCMRVIPRSHLHGHFDWKESDQAEHNVLTQTIDNAERYGQPVDIELKAGEFSIHSDLLVHG
jgi:non-heme Fe2+,alpha-ketoglutarate-dependent halogenase